MSREEPHVVTALVDLAKQLKVQCVVQVGAYDGYEADAVRAATGCRAIAIEGDTRCSPCPGGLEYHYALIGATNCEADFYINSNPALSTQFSRGDNEEMVRLPQQRLDTLCEGIGAVPDALIIDTEGSTMEVLEGCGGLLNSVNLVYAECQTAEIRPGIRILTEVDALLTVHGLTRHHGLPSYSGGAQGNYTWVRP